MLLFGVLTHVSNSPTDETDLILDGLNLIDNKQNKFDAKTNRCENCGPNDVSSFLLVIHVKVWV